MNNAVIECQDLGRRFDDGGGAVEVLQGVSLRVMPGETVAVTGASGSGKSTLLHLLGGLDQASRGRVFLEGHALGQMKDAERARMRNRLLGFVYQFHHLLPEFSALENVAMPLLIGGCRAAEAKARSAAMLERIGLAERMLHRPAELSGGERQRVAIARALVTAPRCLLADEPTGNLDHANARLVGDLLLELCAERNAALVVVTHDPGVASRMQKCFVLDGGRLTQTGV